MTLAKDGFTFFRSRLNKENEIVFRLGCDLINPSEDEQIVDFGSFDEGFCVKIETGK